MKVQLKGTKNYNLQCSKKVAEFCTFSLNFSAQNVILEPFIHYEGSKKLLALV